MKLHSWLFVFLLAGRMVDGQQVYHELYRPQVHFSPPSKWMNDPNGMVFSEGVYHLFYQYYPGSTVWGPMHWGHATSKDLVHWHNEPVALFPDSLGYIFSGSAVIDKNNTAGFGKNAIVAIFTHHDPEGEKAHKPDFQNQSIAYSLDNGKTWTKYAKNPVLKNPGIANFRDPKVMWYAPGKKWIMTLAVNDHISFYSSSDLKEWQKESDFGKDLGAHGGVWECPDLFALDDNGKEIWVLIVNINPGGPNNGSATQYFPGSFDGKSFTPINNETKWLDYGPDEYAGVTWENTGNRRIFLGWMSNWLYATVVPTSTWRSAMTIPRELKIKHAGNDILVSSHPAAELTKIQSKPVTYLNFRGTNSSNIREKMGNLPTPCRLDLELSTVKDISLKFSNQEGDELIIGYDKATNHYYIDRSKSGNVSFHQQFAGRHVAPRFATTDKMDITIFIDVSSAELFADDGLTVMTEIFFPKKPFDQIEVRSPGDFIIEKLVYSKLNSIWK